MWPQALGVLSRLLDVTVKGGLKVAPGRTSEAAIRLVISFSGEAKVPVLMSGERADRWWTPGMWAALCWRLFGSAGVFSYV